MLALVAARPRASAVRAISVVLIALLFLAAPPGALAQAPWTGPIPVDTSGLLGVACVSATQCTAIDSGNREVTFNPESPGSPTAVPIDAGYGLQSIACESETECTVMDTTGDEVTFNPQSPAGLTPITVDNGGGGGLACVSTDQCTAVVTKVVCLTENPCNTAQYGQEVTFDPEAPSGATVATIDDDNNVLNGIACASAAQCTAVDDENDEMTFNPLSPGTPTVVTIDDIPPDMGNHSPTAIACLSLTECTAVDQWGREVTFNPQSPGATSPTAIEPTNETLNSIACPGAGDCVTVDDLGNVFEGDPLGGWSSDHLGSESLTSVSCVSATDCVAVDSAGNEFVSSGHLAPAAGEGVPTISGAAVPGDTLTEAHGSWANGATGYSYQWEQCNSYGADCSAIGGAVNQTYVVSSTDVGHTLRVDETASNSSGSSAPVASSPTAVVQEPSSLGSGRTSESSPTAHMNSAVVNGAAVWSTLVCTGKRSQHCKIIETLTVVETLKRGKVTAVSPHASKRTERKTVIVGAKTVTLAGGQSETVAISLNAAGSHLLKQRHSLKVTFTASFGSRKLAQRTETLRSKRS